MIKFMTPLGRSTAEICEKRSKFIGVLTPAHSEDEVNQIIGNIRAEHYSAKHSCFAWRLADGRERFSDDGEPQGTAGKPIMEILKKNNLSDCVLVVTRYFGGVLLGTGGLQRAYTEAALGAYNNSECAGVIEFSVLKINCDYAFYGRLEAMCSGFEGNTESAEFADDVTATVLIPSENAKRFTDYVFDQSGGKISPEFIENKWITKTRAL